MSNPGNIKTPNPIILAEVDSPPTPDSGHQIIYSTTDGWMVQNSAGVVTPLEKGVVSYKSYALATPGLAGTRYIAGFYDAPAADANLDEGSTTQVYGTANRAKGGHAFLVAGAAGTATGGSGAVTIVVSGISITEAGVRNASDSEVLVADITAMSTNAFYESTKKWLGQVTYTLTVGATGHTAYAADFNYGFCKEEDWGERDFTVTDFEVVGVGGATETGLDIILSKHCTTGWVYSAAAFVPGCTSIICQLSTDYSTDDHLASGKHFAYKRSGLSTEISGSTTAGVVVKIVTTANNAIEYGTVSIGVELS